MKLNSIRLASFALGVAISASALADLTPYSQNFEGLDINSGSALADNGWLVYGNVFDSSWAWVYGYGPFGAPNPGGGFCAIAGGEGGANQGAQYLNTYSDYNNGDHGNGRYIEANIFQERVVGASNLGQTWKFTFDFKASSQYPPAGQTVTRAFYKVLNPNAGWAMVAFPTVVTTAASTSEWATASITINIDSAWTGHILQFGFMNTATQYQTSGVFYDNISFALAPSVGGTVNLGDYSLSPSSKTVTVEIYSADGATLLETINNVAMDGSGNFSAAHNQAGGTYDVTVKADHWLRRLSDDVALSPSGAIGSITLTNGDVDGNNEVGPGDFSGLSAAFGSMDGDSNWNAMADLDGDGEVGPSDFSVLSANFGSSGD